MSQNKKLVELLEGFTIPICGGLILKLPEIERLADYLIENGVIVPPCKVGDTVYVIDIFDFEPCKKSGDGGDVCPHLYAEPGFGYECRKTRFGEKPNACAQIKTKKIEHLSHILNFWDSFDKTIFLTKEEAEQALKGGGE